MNRIIYPPKDNHTNLRQKLQPGEEMVLDIFDTCLPLDWEIYIQPHLNGLRPDFVLLNPNIGIGVFEVKDWDINAMPYFVENGKLSAKNKEGIIFYPENPVKKVNLYKQEIYDLYCPRVGATTAQYGSHAGFGAITAGVIFPFAETSKIKELLKCFLPDKNFYKKYSPLSGKNEILNKKIYDIFPESGRKHSSIMNDKFADDLRGWLIEPDFAKVQREPLNLDKQQEFLASTCPQNKYRRIRGPAGSGKTLVLASRAARLANENKSILIVTFNITLVHYIRDLVVRGLAKASLSRTHSIINGQLL